MAIDICTKALLLETECGSSVKSGIVIRNANKIDVLVQEMVNFKWTLRSSVSNGGTCRHTHFVAYLVFARKVK